jgi:hypothetical protein
MISRMTLMPTQRRVNMSSNDFEIDVAFDTLAINGDPTKLYEELAKAQAKFTPVPKMSSGQVGNQKFKYAGYATLMRCVRPALSEHGIVVIQPLHSRGDHAITTTVLAGHGASIRSSFSFKADFTKKDKNGVVSDDPQEFGRSHTYYRRYQLQAMLGIEGDRDADDLPDVNEEEVKAPKAVKATVSVVAQPASVEPTLPASVVPSEPTTNGKGKKPVEEKPEAKPVGKPTNESGQAKLGTGANADTRTVNEKLQEGMKQLGWKMPEVKEFFKVHIDPEGFDKADNLTVEQKTKLFETMVAKAGVIPF